MPLRLLALTLLMAALSSCSGSGNDTTDASDSSTPEEEMSNGLTGGDNNGQCPVGAVFDSEENYCYVDCTDLTDDQCDALDMSVFGEFDEFIDNDFSGTSANNQDSNAANQTIATYTIEPDLQLTNLLNQQPEDNERFQQIWQSASGLLPQASIKQSLSEFHISTDGKEGVLAFVTTDDNQPGKWIIAFDNADYSSSSDPEFIHTTIHEFGHVVFLGSGQVNMAETGDCPNYAIAEGCSLATSFINRFYQQFWKDTFEEHQSIVGPEESEEGVTQFYEKYQDQFVSEYSATNPVEDAAEVFTRFVLSNKPNEGGSVAQQKIRSLYEFEELVQLRTVIRGKLNAMR